MKKDSKPKISKAARQCNLDFWNAKYIKALKDAREACLELSKIYDEIAKEQKEKK